RDFSVIQHRIAVPGAANREGKPDKIDGFARLLSLWYQETLCRGHGPPAIGFNAFPSVSLTTARRFWSNAWRKADA
ncbi:MAG TPA: hypothetical protein VMT24_16265, partial [Aggregatilineaceae bacterium]|nr:hypothetical protein [Aggregatilineaceae bacterium]